MKNLITYKKLCDMMTVLKQFIIENPDVFRTPGRIQNHMHLASNNCKKIREIYQQYKYGNCSIEQVASAVVIAKFWHDNALFENVMGSIASLTYIVSVYEPRACTVHPDFYIKAKCLCKFMHEDFV